MAARLYDRRSKSLHGPHCASSEIERRLFRRAWQRLRNYHIAYACALETTRDLCAVSGYNIDHNPHMKAWEAAQASLLAESRKTEIHPRLSFVGATARRLVGFNSKLRSWSPKLACLHPIASMHCSKNAAVNAPRLSPAQRACGIGRRWQSDPTPDGSFQGPIICRSAALGKPPRAQASLGRHIDPRPEACAPYCGSGQCFSLDHGHTSPVGLPSIVAPSWSCRERGGGGQVLQPADGRLRAQIGPRLRQPADRQLDAGSVRRKSQSLPSG